MVRVNLIDPRALADQHLVAEYNEILMLLGYVRKHPARERIPPTYRLGQGHILFFKDKLRYVKARHEDVKREMRRRGFRTERTIDLAEFPPALRNDWTPAPRDLAIIKERIIWKIGRKPTYYRYEGAPEDAATLIRRVRRAGLSASRRNSTRSR